jgi:phospholipase C
MRRVIRALVPLLLLAGVMAGPGAGPAGAHPKAPHGMHKLKHLVVIYLENHSFDNLYGLFPGADGLSSATPANTVQLDEQGKPYETLPQTDPNIPQGLPNAPFEINQFVPPDMKTRDLVHRFYQNQVQINGGRNNKFVQVSDAKGLTMGYYDTNQLPLARLAARYTLADNFYMGAFGGSFLNHMWLACACTPVFPNAPADMHSVVDPATGLPTVDKQMTPAPDDHVVNTAFTVNTPHPADVAPDHLVPNQNLPTIGDRLSGKGVSWAWYSGGWDDAVAGHPDPLFQFHHQPFAYFAPYRDGTAARARHLKDEKKFFSAARAGRLPAVSFVKPLGPDNEHPGYADLLSGEQHVLDLIDAVRSGPDWRDTAIVVTYDENGGFWDHAAPPVLDRWGPGNRVPTIVISPLARRHFIDHTRYDTTSILALIEHRWGLEPLTSRDAAANDMRAAFGWR